MERNIFYEGNDKGVILLHSFTSGPQDFVSIARSLNREGYSVYTPTFHGHGEGNNLDTLLDSNVEYWIQDVEDALDFMESKGFKRVTVFGLSLGGKIGFNNLINDDRVIAGGIFSSPIIPGNASGIKPFYNKWYKDQMTSLNLPMKSESEINEKLELLLSPGDELSKDNLKHIADLKKPFFIAQGGNDEIINAEKAIDLKNMLTKTQVHFHWYDGAPHVITVGAVSHKLRVDLLAFLSTINY